jgi:hypothetical protein
MITKHIGIGTQKRIFLIVLMSVVLCSLVFYNIIPVQANLTSSIPPMVTAQKMIVNATVIQVDGDFQVNVDAEYQMHTIYGLGDSYVTQNWGFGLMVDPSPYVTVTVTQDTLEAHYPIPSNASNISVKINGFETEWWQDKGKFHLFGENIPQINWTISPVPRDFSVRVHYEEPISKTIEAYDYLGDYAFILPLFGRFGCSNISYPLYDWAGYSSTEYNIRIDSTISQVGTYSINNLGTLTQLNATTSNENGFESVRTTFSHGEEENTGILGAIAVLDSPVDVIESFPIVSLLVAVSAIAAVVLAVGLLVYHKKHKNKP